MTHDFLLGTAQWGWTVSRDEAFAQLDAWLQAGMRRVDCATNYPINKNPSDFRAAQNILLEYLQAHPDAPLEITMKIGSLDNMRTPDINLAPSFLLMMSSEYRRLFGDALQTVMLHWDKRDDETAVRATLEALLAIQNEEGITAGLSGIDHPDVYARANEDYGLIFDIQVKHNIIHSDVERYAPFYGKGHRFYAYGINAGGLKLQGLYPADSTLLARGGNPDMVHHAVEKIRAKMGDWNLAFVRPPIQNMTQLGLLYTLGNDKLNGAVLGFSSVRQMENTLEHVRDLQTYEYTDVYRDLMKL
ncbi:MAG: aldo/keto reductase [Saprospiraceae bacterium]|nr:aldo/keto reductase [Saprospiraceae bacterium]